MTPLAGSRCVLGVDLGGTKIACGAVDGAGRVLARMEVPSPASDQVLMVDALVDVVERTREAASGLGLTVETLGIGAAGYVLHDEGKILAAPNIAWDDMPLRNEVARRCGLATFLDNDANAAALGERLAGVCRGVDDFVYITLGTGIGGGICAGGHLCRGHRGTGAEIGHMVIDPEGPPCGCGNKGCLEAFASGTALARVAAGLAAGDPASLLVELSGGDPGRLTGEMVAEAAERGDKLALDAFARCGFYLGVAIVSLIHLFDPEMVILGGGVSRSGHLLLPEIERVIADRGIPQLVAGTSVALSTLGVDAGLIGAAALAWEGMSGAP